MTHETNNAAALLAEATESRAWPFEEARKILDRYKDKGLDGRTIIFETGYGPSGLPHIGTFGEVARTSMVRHAFHVLTENKVATRLICFSDDMDGLRKIPDNVPNKEMLEPHLGKPLTSIPDPYGTHEGFGQHNNNRLQQFLDAFGFDYEFVSATQTYRSGRFDETLRHMLEVYDKVTGVILPTLGAERRATYSPFLPLCPRTGVVLQVPLTGRDVAAGTISYADPETGDEVTVPVTGGHCKLQWKADWAMRWAALGIDYEMAGKDLIDSVKLSGAICRILGAQPPAGFNYELFLDQNGEKISKSRGNGLTIDEWLRYASRTSLSQFMYQSPRKAKRLYFDVIPRQVDDYQTFLEKYPEQEIKEQLGNPVWHIHKGNPPTADIPISFSMLLNLVSASNSEDAGVLWGFIRGYAPEANAENHPQLEEMVQHAIHYFHDFVAPTRTYRLASDQERKAMADLATRLAEMPQDSAGSDLQTLVFEIGKTHEFENLRDWFKALYEVLLGQSQGPRFGSFVALYGVAATCELISRALAGELVG